jgi:hypothetical protein
MIWYVWTMCIARNSRHALTHDRTICSSQKTPNRQPKTSLPSRFPLLLEVLITNKMPSMVSLCDTSPYSPTATIPRCVPRCNIASNHSTNSLARPDQAQGHNTHCHKAFWFIRMRSSGQRGHELVEPSNVSCARIHDAYDTNPNAKQVVRQEIKPMVKRLGIASMAKDRRQSQRPCIEENSKASL